MKKLKICLLLTLSFCMAAAGCSNNKSKEEDKKPYHMYYLDEEGNQVIAEPYAPKASDTASMIDEFIGMQSEKIDSDEQQHLLPDKVTIENSSLNSGILSLNMSSSYRDMKSTREILARVGLVRTFAQIPKVTRIQILVEGEPLKDSQGKDVGMMAESSFVENSGKEINTYQNIDMTLYFADETGKKLVPEERNVYYSSNIPLERVVVEQLIKGPKSGGHYATLPSETNLLSATISDEICYVNFDQSFQENTLNVSQEISIYSIVNSLTTVCKVKEVQFSINGESKVSFKGKVRLDQLFMWNPDYNKEEKDS